MFADEVTSLLHPIIARPERAVATKIIVFFIGSPGALGSASEGSGPVGAPQSTVELQDVAAARLRKPRGTESPHTRGAQQTRAARDAFPRDVVYVALSGGFGADAV